MPRGGDTSAKARASGKRVGRPPKAKVEQTADKNIAGEVLAMDGPADHERKCHCDVCTDHRHRRCKCEKKPGEPADPRCETFAGHRICRCEVCGWWEGLAASDKRLGIDTRRYLTDRRDGKPVQFIGTKKDEHVAIKVTVEHIGSPNPPAAKAK